MGKYEQIFLIVLSLFWQNYIVGHGFWAIFQDTLGHVLSIQITKNHHHFNQKLYEYVMKK